MLRATAQSRPGYPVRGILGFAFLVWLLPLQGLAADATRGGGKQRALECEKRGAWLEACRCYDDLLKKDRNNPGLRESYLRCLRRLRLIARHTDDVYRPTLKKLSPTQALDAYEQVLGLLSAAYPDRAKTHLTQLFAQGLQELRLALDEPAFVRVYLPTARPAAVAAYRARLAAWPARKVARRGDARRQVLAVIRAASRDGVPLKPVVASAFAMEFAAGACNALDEYSSFLTPGNLTAAQSVLRGKAVGVGVEVGVVEDRLQVTRVYHKGPAYDGGLARGDRVLRIAGQGVERLPADAAADRLRGEPGTTVEVEVLRGTAEKRTFKLTRRAVTVPSVEFEAVELAESVTAGYVRIGYFSDSTVQEMREVIASLSPGVKGIILDLRGNPGGMFHAAVRVAELFLSDGVIVIGQSSYPEYNRSFKVETGGPLQGALPLVVLIDGETASAAEVLAGALKEGRPGRVPTVLLGQTSYGKGSVQCILPLEKGALGRPAGIRLTVARLYSPSKEPYTGRGVTPHEASSLEGEALLGEARKKLLEMISPKSPDMAPRPMPAVVRVGGPIS